MCVCCLFNVARLQVRHMMRIRVREARMLIMGLLNGKTMPLKVLFGDELEPRWNKSDGKKNKNMAGECNFTSHAPRGSEGFMVLIILEELVWRKKTRKGKWVLARKGTTEVQNRLLKFLLWECR